MDEIKHFGDAHISFVLVGNKTDLEEKFLKLIKFNFIFEIGEQ